MEESGLTLAILREIRDNTAKTNERVDHLTERVDQVVHEQIRQGTTMIEVLRVQERLVDAVVAIDQRQGVMERCMGQVVTELQRVNARLDNVFAGPLGGYVRAHDQRIDALEHRVDALEHRGG